MGRPRGRRNEDYDEKRAALARSVAFHLVAEDGSPAPLAHLARAAGVSVPTLKHYFGSHDGVVEAALAEAGKLGAVHLERARRPQGESVRESLRMLLADIVVGWRNGVGTLHEAGLVLGMSHQRLGPTYLREILEPTILAVEQRLGRHVERGDLEDEHPRVMALALLSPVVLALLHQTSLGGDRTRPLDLDAFLDAHVDRFLRGHARVE